MDEQFDRLFKDSRELPENLSAKIRAQIQGDTTPVQPMWSTKTYVLVFALIFAAGATLFAGILGTNGLKVLTPMGAWEMLSVLLLLALWSGAMVARSMRPAGGSLHSWISGAFAVAAYEVLVMKLFRDYSMTRFTRSGLICLGLGVACGALTALPIWLVVRRGLVVNPVGAGTVFGLVGGLAGVAALTMHCPITNVPHTAVWHAGVLVICMSAGAISGRLLLR